MKNVLFLSLAIICLSSCSKDYANRDFGSFEVLDNNRTVVMDGDFTENTLYDFNRLLAEFPNVKRLKIQQCNGNTADDTDLQLAAKIFERGMDTHILDNGAISGGGLDLFLAGTLRDRCSNADIGVHEWSAQDASGNTIKATDFPVGDAVHQPYIDYYRGVGMDSTVAADFYYFSINAAPVEEVYWMTKEEVELFGLLTD